MQEQSNLGEAEFGFAVQEAVVPHPAEGAGQHVLEHGPEELDQRQGAVGGLGLSVSIAEGDAAPRLVVADHGHSHRRWPALCPAASQNQDTQSLQP